MLTIKSNFNGMELTSRIYQNEKFIVELNQKDLKQISEHKSELPTNFLKSLGASLRQATYEYEVKNARNILHKMKQ